MDTYLYQLDEGLVIRHCSSNWDAFATANGGTDEILRRAIIGTPLFRWITGDETIGFYRSIFARLQGQESEWNFNFSCNSSSLRRDFHCRISRLPAGYMVENTLLEEARLRQPLMFTAIRFGDGLTKCSMCCRYRIDGAWRPQEALAQVDTGRPIELTYAICPDCSRMAAGPGHAPTATQRGRRESADLSGR